jgi:tRNA-Thr(GGU) m(6)t(6)A37 methyltransferase TsaA
MVRENEIRTAEKVVDWPAKADADLIFIGRIHTPWTNRMSCPRQGRSDGPICRIKVFAPWREALQGIADYHQLEVFYWLHLSRRDLVLQSPRDDGTARDAFALRSPARPNPIGTSIVTVTDVSDGSVFVQGIDRLDGTPLLDLKPDRNLFTPLAPPTPGDADREPV